MGGTTSRTKIVSKELPKGFIPRAVRLGRTKTNWGAVGAIAGILSIPSSLGITVYQSKHPVVVEKIIPAPAVPKVPVESYDLTGFIRPKGGITSKNLELSLTPSSDHAYFLSPVYASEHSFVDLWFTPLTSQSNYYLIVENSFIIIFGDGDRQAITLKAYPSWKELEPKGKEGSGSPRYYLPEAMPIGQQVHAQVDITARTNELGHKLVTLRISFYDKKNHVVVAGDNEKDMVWEFETTGDLNGKTRYGVGLIDPARKNKPVVKFGGIKVTEKIQ